jgi:branched-chain amino acid transport system substrate-binding protein
VTQSATDDALAQHGWTHWFRAVGNNSDQAKPASAYIQNTIKPNCTFVASDGTAYGHGLAAIVFQVLSDSGQKVEPEEQVAPAQKDYSALVTKIQGSGCKALFYGGYSPEAGLIRKQMTEAGLDDVVMVGGDGIKDATFTGTAGKAGDGTISVCPCVSPADLAASAGNVAGIQKLITDYKGKFGEDPGIYAAEGWDVAQIFISAFKAGKTDRESITQYIRGLQGFAGLAKSYSWQPDGELFPASRTMFVYEVKNQEFEFLGDAATVTAPAE